MNPSVIAIYTTAEAGTPLHALPEATLESGKGLVGDRYYDGKGTFSEKLKDTADWEVTLIESEEIQRFNQIEDLLFASAMRYLKAFAFANRAPLWRKWSTRKWWRRWPIGPALERELLKARQCGRATP